MSGDSTRPHSLAVSCVSCLLGHSERVWSVSWHPSGRLLASCSSDKTVRVWRNASGDLAAASGWECCALLEGVHTRTVRCVSWSPCGRLLASAGFDGRVAVWSIRQPPQPVEQQREGDSSGAPLPASGIAHLLSSPRLVLDCVCQLEGHENEVKGVSWSADGRLLASCSRDKTVWLWEKDEGKDGELGFECVSVASGHSADVKHVAFHPQLPLLLSASYDNTVRVWREEEEDTGGEWESAHTLEGHNSTVWMADWLRQRHDQQQQQGEQVQQAHVSLSVVSVSDDRTVRVWSPSQPLSSQAATGIAAAPYQCTQTIATPHTRSIFALHQHAHTGSDSAAQQHHATRQYSHATPAARHTLCRAHHPYCTTHQHRQQQPLSHPSTVRSRLCLLCVGIRVHLVLRCCARRASRLSVCWQPVVRTTQSASTSWTQAAAATRSRIPTLHLTSTLCCTTSALIRAMSTACAFIRPRHLCCSLRVETRAVSSCGQ